ncbi:hypothetical protein [Brevibacillus brevis]|uniref:hypothetical protein n=1 Tax=Brevibacillus brevis TaxID=1393 RepID=UPI0007D89A2D|nr:hypothetical protein [Brevibacillus brevis]
MDDILKDPTIIRLILPIFVSAIVIPLLRNIPKSLQEESEIERIEKSLLLKRYINHPKKIGFLMLVISIAIGSLGLFLLGEWLVLILFMLFIWFGYSMTQPNRLTPVWQMLFLSVVISYFSFNITSVLYFSNDEDEIVSRMVACLFYLSFVILFGWSLLQTVNRIIADFSIPKKLVFTFENGEILSVLVKSLTHDRNYIVDIITSESENAILPHQLKAENLEVVINRNKIQKVICIRE